MTSSLLASVARALFRFPDELIEPYAGREMLRARASLAVYAFSLMATGISVRREAELAFFLIAVSVVSVVAWLVFCGRRMRSAREELPGVDGQRLFWALVNRSLFPPRRDDSREVLLYGVFAVTLVAYLGLQVAYAFGV